MSDERLSGPTVPTPNQISRRDAAALIGVLAVMETTSLAEELEPDIAARLTRRLHRDGLLEQDQSPAALRSALNGLNHRLRVALGEYAKDPTSDPDAD